MSWPGRKRSGVPWLSLPLGGLLALVFALDAPWEQARLAPTALESAALDPLAQLAAAPVAPSDELTARPSRQGSLQRGETLGAVFARLDLTPAEAHAAAEAARDHLDLRQLRPGARWSAFDGDGGALARFDLALDGRGELRLERGADAVWSASFREYRRETRRRAISGVLDGALEESIERTGADASLAYAMAEVLQWDLDFTRDLQPGDRFRILFEEIWLEDRFHEIGDVVALEYAHDGGASFDAFRFGEEDAYYDGDGRPLQKLFLRSPLPYSRVTSRFTHRRFHPILKVFRPHYGVDYGAPTGTAVRATASGTVTFAGWDGGGGKTVKVRHPNAYLTCYLHLSRFASGLRAGDRVRQGDVIGYVGSTGLATAPHLDYRVQQSGRWIDPLSLASAPAEPLTAARLEQFRTAQIALRAGLESGDAASTVAAAPAARASSAAETPVETARK